MTGPIRVLVVDDQQLLRRGLTMLLDTVDDVDVVGQAGGGREALALVASIESDVLLTDVRMPTMDGLELPGRVPGTVSGPAGGSPDHF